MADMFNNGADRKAHSLKITIAERIKESGAARLLEEMEKVLYETEMYKRSGACGVCYEIILRLEKELDKLRPDVKTYNANHEIVGETFSETQMKKRRELQEKINKGHNAFNKAMTSADCEDVYKFNQANGNQSKSSGKPEGQSGGKDPEGSSTQNS